MKYSEIFYSIQGEGVHVGVPSVFFRTSYCNLRCWFCDTPYTSWEPENRDITPENAFIAIANLSMCSPGPDANNCQHIVITGGEPFMFGDELQTLCGYLKDEEFHITIETNGTIYHDTPADLISISPKLRNSTPNKERSEKWSVTHERERINLDTFRRFSDNNRCQWKFVVVSTRDLDEIYELECDVPIDRNNIILMPEGRTQQQTQMRLGWLSEACLKEGYRLSPRLHVDIWGDQRST